MRTGKVKKRMNACGKCEKRMNTHGESEKRIAFSEMCGILGIYIALWLVSYDSGKYFSGHVLVSSKSIFGYPGILILPV